MHQISDPYIFDVHIHYIYCFIYNLTKKQYASLNIYGMVHNGCELFPLKLSAPVFFALNYLLWPVDLTD